MSTPPPYGGRSLLADTSAWTAIRRAEKIGNVPHEWGAAIEADLIWTSPVVKLELLHAAANRADFDETQDELDVLHEAQLTQTVALAAIGALRELAYGGSAGNHKVGLGDALIAASAQAAGIGILHYNHKDFEKLAEVLACEQVPLAPPGTFETDSRLDPWSRFLMRSYKAAIRYLSESYLP